MNVTVLGIGGSLREHSHSLQALHTAVSSAALAGASTELFDLRRFPLPLYDDRSEIESYPDTVVALLNAVRQADALIFSTPVYHGIVSGALKNALDFLELLADDEQPWLEGKVVGLISVAGGRAGDNALNSLEYACRALHALTLPYTVAVPGSAFAADRLQDQKVEQRLIRLGREVARYAALLGRRKQAPAEARRAS